MAEFGTLKFVLERLSATMRLIDRLPQLPQGARIKSNPRKFKLDLFYAFFELPIGYGRLYPVGWEAFRNQGRLILVGKFHAGFIKMMLGKIGLTVQSIQQVERNRRQEGSASEAA